MDALVQQLINGLSTGSTYALIALGYTMVYGVLRLINFAHGDVYMIGAVAGFHLAGWTMQRQMPLGTSLLVIFLGSMLVCAVLGFAIEFLAYRPLRHRPRLVLLITAIGRVYLAFCSQTQRESLLEILSRSNKEEDKLAKNKAELQKILSDARAQGYATAVHPRRISEQVSIAVPPTFIFGSACAQHGMTPFSAKLTGLPIFFELSNSRPLPNVPR